MDHDLVPGQALDRDRERKTEARAVVLVELAQALQFFLAALVEPGAALLAGMRGGGNCAILDRPGRAKNAGFKAS